MQSSRHQLRFLVVFLAAAAVTPTLPMRQAADKTRLLVGTAVRPTLFSGVGLPLHISQLDLDTAAIAANIARLTALGVQIYIAELDVSLPLDAHGRARNEDLLRQAEAYRGVVRACLQNQGCTAIQT
jgi:hypothetical protein